MKGGEYDLKPRDMTKILTIVNKKIEKKRYSIKKYTKNAEKYLYLIKKKHPPVYPFTKQLVGSNSTSIAGSHYPKIIGMSTNTSEYLNGINEINTFLKEKLSKTVIPLEDLTDFIAIYTIYIDSKPHMIQSNKPKTKPKTPDTRPLTVYKPNTSISSIETSQKILTSISDKREEPRERIREEPRERRREEPRESRREEPRQSRREEPRQRRREEPRQSRREEPRQSRREEPRQSRREEPRESRREELIEDTVSESSFLESVNCQSVNNLPWDSYKIRERKNLCKKIPNCYFHNASRKCLRRGDEIPISTIKNESFFYNKEDFPEFPSSDSESQSSSDIKVWESDLSNIKQRGPKYWNRKSIPKTTSKPKTDKIIHRHRPERKLSSLDDEEPWIDDSSLDTSSYDDDDEINNIPYDDGYDTGEDSWEDWENKDINIGKYSQ